MNIAKRLEELNLILPPAPPPVAAYIPAVRAGELIFISGQLPRSPEQPLIAGAVPDAVSLEQAQQAARVCIVNALAILQDELSGDWAKFVRIAKLGVFVNCVPGYDRQHEVANAASELLEQVLGPAGKHARFAVGAPGLPLNACVELELTAQVR